MQSVERWGVFEVEFRGNSAGNPFVEVELSAEFRLGHRAINVAGFYDGDGVYRVRFSPDTVGEWQYVTQSNRPELACKAGSFVCTAATAGCRRAPRRDPRRAGRRAGWSCRRASPPNRVGSSPSKRSPCNSVQSVKRREA